MNVVISQSMYFPWVGLLEQVRLADIFVHYDDVQFSRGSFTNRVQVKTELGLCWLSVPVKGQRLGQAIDEVQVDDRQPWRKRHRDVLCRAYRLAPFLDDALAVVDSAFDRPSRNLGEVARGSMLSLLSYFGLDLGRRFVDSRALPISGGSSQRVHDIVVSLKGDTYITGHGARRYLDHHLFEDSGINVRYMDYRCERYPQRHGTFTPYVSALDLVANCGKAGLSKICSSTIDWRQFIDGPT
jgi:hypothetical protein